MPSAALSAHPPPVAAATARRTVALARRVAAEVGESVRRARARGAPEVRRKAVGDFVTDVDVRAEGLARRLLRQLDPTAGFVGEEGSPERPDADRVWLVDPIDGTSNFSRSLPLYGVSVACMHRGWPIAAAVFCMPEAALYSAATGLGAFCKRRRLEIPAGRSDDGAIFGCQWHRGQLRVPFLRRIQEGGARIRNLGCTVWQLCQVAAGNLDANVQAQGRLWDFAAAALVVLEAGGRFTDLRGRPVFPLSPTDPNDHPSLAAPAAVHRHLLRLLRATVSKR